MSTENIEKRTINLENGINISVTDCVGHHVQGASIIEVHTTQCGAALWLPAAPSASPSSKTSQAAPARYALKFPVPRYERSRQ